MKTFKPISIGNISLKNRIIRSATYEGYCSEHGIPEDGYYKMYEALAANEAGAIITGFAFTSEDGKAMQSKQAGIESENKISFFSEMTARVHQFDCPIFLQISHAGRQTTKARAGGKPGASSTKRSLYFRSRPRVFSTSEVYAKVEEYALAAMRAKKAGFDGVQIHAAHGYLAHQFLLPAINQRNDEFGIDHKTNIGTGFLEEIIKAIRDHCGDDFPILIKISGGIDLKPGFSNKQFSNLIGFLDKMKVDGIEISYGTMDHALNIFRGDFPLDLILRENPFFKSGNIISKKINEMMIKAYFRPVRLSFSPTYNLHYAQLAKSLTDIPIMSVGGFRNSTDIIDAIENDKTDIVGMSRPFLCEPDLVRKMIQHKSWVSECINCNYCAVMCDSGNPTKCYQPKKRRNHETFQSIDRHNQP